MGRWTLKTSISSDEPEPLDCLCFGPTVEPRGTAFQVKEGRIDEFVSRFKEKYGDRFIIKPSRQWLEEGLFGLGKPHPRTLEFLGDVFAVAIGNAASVCGKTTNRRL